MRKPSRLRFLATTLIAVGLAVATVPTVLVEIADRLEVRSRQAEVERWVEERRPPDQREEVATPKAPSVIEPGAAGYLLEIPKLALRAVVHELEPEVFLGKNTPRLKRFGLGQVPYSSGLKNVAPGAEGTAVIAGHRTTSGAPFRNLHLLEAGDRIIIRGMGGEQHWKVVHSATVRPHEIGAIRSRPGLRRLAIMACSPPFSAARRLIVYAEPAHEEEE